MAFLLILSGNERVQQEQSMILGGEWNNGTKQSKVLTGCRHQMRH